MKNRKYKVSRENIYVGKVVRADKIYRYEGVTEVFHNKPGQLNTVRYDHYRSMLFVPDEEKLSNDLLYQSPSYPILNITDDDTCLRLGKGSIVIKDALNLAPLLEYFKYNKELTFEDIMKIRRTFFTGRFTKDNGELFGYKEHMTSVLPGEYFGVLDDLGDYAWIDPVWMEPIMWYENMNAFKPPMQEGRVRRLKRF